MIRITIGASLLLGLTLTAGPARAQVTYLGEACWQVRGGTPDEPEAFQWRVGVMSYGAGHFVVAGRATRADSGRIEPIHGNAELAGGLIAMTVVSSEAASISGTRESSTVNVFLSVSTLDGQYNKIGFEGRPGFSEILTDSGTLEAVPCP